jgi:type IV secretory pathway TrbD component
MQNFLLLSETDFWFGLRIWIYLDNVGKQRGLPIWIYKVWNVKMQTKCKPKVKQIQNIGKLFV